jgi:plasmid stability protein
MASLLIRNVDPVLHARLKSQAAEHRRPLEEEARVLLRKGVGLSETVVTGADIVRMAERLFGAANGVDLDLPPRDWREDRPPPDFGDEPDAK